MVDVTNTEYMEYIVWSAFFPEFRNRLHLNTGEYRLDIVKAEVEVF